MLYGSAKKNKVEKIKADAKPTINQVNFMSKGLLWLIRKLFLNLLLLLKVLFKILIPLKVVEIFDLHQNNTNYTLYIANKQWKYTSIINYIEMVVWF